MRKWFRASEAIANDAANNQQSDSNAHGVIDKASWLVVLILIAIPITFNAVGLLPEIRYCTPAGNDQVFHSVFIERADQAISDGDDPFDHWLPELEVGFPEFFYYQNLPHLVVVGLYRLLLKQVTLLRIFNLVRYLLMVTFPLAVYWSMRKMEFSPASAVVAAAFSSMLSSGVSYGFDFRSYVWSGIGMFPQLCAMHLMFISSACVRRVLMRGEGFASAIIASAAMLLSDLLYGYMFGIVVAVLWLLYLAKALAEGKTPRAFVSALGRSSVLLAMVFVPVAMITAYQVVPFLRQIAYLNQALPLKLTSLNAPFASNQSLPTLAQLGGFDFAIPFTFRHLTLFFGGHFFDNDRLPVLTAIIVMGIIWGLIARHDRARLTLVMLGVWMVLLTANPLRDLIIPIMPFLNLVPLFRFVSGVDFGAILAVGLGAELIWNWLPFRAPAARSFVFAIVVLLLYCPLALERWQFYQRNKHGIETTDQAVRDDQNLRGIISWLKKAPPGRVYAGTRGNWGNWMAVGGVHVYDLLPVELLATVMPWQTLSLNAPLLWRLNIPSETLCRLFNIRYIIAPPALRVPNFYDRVLSNSEYDLYRVDSGGYMQFGRVAEVMRLPSSESLFRINSAWLASTAPAKGIFAAFAPSDQTIRSLKTFVDLSSESKESLTIGSITDEIVTPDSLEARVATDSTTLLVIKMTYHPNWHVFVDGRENPFFMVSPSYLGTMIKSGRHLVRAEYRTSRLKQGLLVLSGLTLALVGAIGVFCGDDFFRRPWIVCRH
jgi:hypothetical protein